MSSLPYICHPVFSNSRGVDVADKPCPEPPLRTPQFLTMATSSSSKFSSHLKIISILFPSPSSRIPFPNYLSSCHSLEATLWTVCQLVSTWIEQKSWRNRNQNEIWTRAGSSSQV